ncbi:hypothetical protein KM043_007087 [Ampulex compressa]|nr:hypothetical protein KM043_007087 [Ampulex compressa]
MPDRSRSDGAAHGNAEKLSPPCDSSPRCADTWERSLKKGELRVRPYINREEKTGVARARNSVFHDGVEVGQSGRPKEIVVALVPRFSSSTLPSLLILDPDLNGVCLDSTIHVSHDEN